MPELPEVERARKMCHDRCVGATITNVVAFDDTIVFADGTTAESFAAALTNRKVVDTFRRGKMFALILDGKGTHPVMHFGMTGNLAVKGDAPFVYADFKPDATFPPRFCKFIMTLSTGTELAFSDPRRLARIRLAQTPLETSPLFSGLGFDALVALPEREAFTAALRARCPAAAAAATKARASSTRPIKALLLDQAFCAGIGNWVADEVLYAARIHPAEPAALLSDDDVARLHAAIMNVVSTACAVDADAQKFPRDWLFHYRWGKGRKPGTVKNEDGEAVMPDGNVIVFDTCAGRTSAIVPAVQILKYGSAATLGEPGRKRKKAAGKATKRRQKSSDDDEDDDDDSKDGNEGVPTSKKRPQRQKRAVKRKREEDDDIDSDNVSDEDFEGEGSEGAKDEEDAVEENVKVEKAAVRPRRALSKRGSRVVAEPQEDADVNKEEVAATSPPTTRPRRMARARSSVLSRGSAADD
ncbi:hypothetical protein HDU84_004390 [Entophlyctis sp. JEL0112]|nr:hypothetical protein HDU84_004390 [Entophlyctis sp. JEL0112]